MRFSSKFDALKHNRNSSTFKNYCLFVSIFSHPFRDDFFKFNLNKFWLELDRFDFLTQEDVNKIEIQFLEASFCFHPPILEAINCLTKVSNKKKIFQSSLNDLANIHIVYLFMIEQFKLCQWKENELVELFCKRLNNQDEKINTLHSEINLIIKTIKRVLADKNGDSELLVFAIDEAANSKDLNFQEKLAAIIKIYNQQLGLTNLSPNVKLSYTSILDIDVGPQANHIVSNDDNSVSKDNVVIISKSNPKELIIKKKHVNVVNSQIFNKSCFEDKDQENPFKEINDNKKYKQKEDPFIELIDKEVNATTVKQDNHNERVEFPNENPPAYNPAFKQEDEPMGLNMAEKPSIHNGEENAAFNPGEYDIPPTEANPSFNPEFDEKEYTSPPLNSEEIASSAPPEEKNEEDLFVSDLERKLQKLNEGVKEMNFLLFNKNTASKTKVNISPNNKNNNSNTN